MIKELERDVNCSYIGGTVKYFDYILEYSDKAFTFKTLKTLIKYITDNNIKQYMLLSWNNFMGYILLDSEK